MRARPRHTDERDGGCGTRCPGGGLIRNAEAIEKLARITTLAVDKTGTLTEGKPRLAQVLTADGFSADEVLGLAAWLEQASEHPLAHAVTVVARESRLPLSAPTVFQSRTGGGVSGTVDGRRVMVGKPEFLRDSGVSGVDSLESVASPLCRPAMRSPCSWPWMTMQPAP